MTGSWYDEEEESSLVINVDGGVLAEPQPESEPATPSRPPWFRRHRYQLYILGFLLGICLAGYGIGAATYQPSSRLPTLAFETGDPLYGTNATVAAELEIVRESLEAPEALELKATGPVFHVELPRTVADRLFGERDETLTLFSTVSPVAESRFLVAMDADETEMLAIEAPLGLSPRAQPTGVFLALDPDDPTLGPLVDAVTAILPDLRDLDVLSLSSERLYVFGPFQAGDTGLEARVESNRVTSHLASRIAAADGDISLATPAFLLTPGPPRGRINALYHPARRLIMEPLWGTSATTSLAHEFVHAYMDTVVEDREGLLVQAADYFDGAHPVLYGEVVGDLYERLSREGRAEETLAFLVGAIAAEQTKTVSTRQLLENQGNLAVSEAILYSDLVLLVEAGLLPACMRPATPEQGPIQQAYYDDVELACS